MTSSAAEDPIAPTPRARLAAFRTRHARAEHVAFFAAGFVFDAFMVTRIDDWPVLVQQGAYLACIGLLLVGMARWDDRGVAPPAALARAWPWAGPLLHFMLGTLLNAYALFYVKSASGWTALGVATAIGGLLIVNELPRFRRQGPVVLYGLYSTCLTSYFAYLYPVLLGRLRSWMFLLAVASAILPLAGLVHWHRRLATDSRRVLRHMVAPSAGAQAVLLVLFALNLIPPVPLSLRHIGIYHTVGRDPGGHGYRLTYEPGEWWQPWVRDDQTFRARPGDRMYCFVRVFAPRDFKDEIRVRWTYWDPSRGWVSSDAVAMQVAGGREEGFGAWAYKQNYQPGAWRVHIETAEGREIGSRSFTVTPDPEPLGTRAVAVITR